MFLEHSAVINNDKTKAELFYQKFLGLNKILTFNISPELAQNFWSTDGSKAIETLIFGKNNFFIEVAIIPEYKSNFKAVSHIGFRVKDIDKIINRAKKFNIKFIDNVENVNNRFVYFKDFSGNLFEIKKYKFQHKYSRLHKILRWLKKIIIQR